MPLEIGLGRQDTRCYKIQDDITTDSNLFHFLISVVDFNYLAHCLFNDQKKLCLLLHVNRSVPLYLEKTTMSNCVICKRENYSVPIFNLTQLTPCTASFEIPDSGSAFLTAE